MTFHDEQKNDDNEMLGSGTTQSQPAEADTGMKAQQRNTTESVAESLERVRQQLDPTTSTITLNILGVDTPITFKDRRQIIVGRLNPSSHERPDVDLSGLLIDATSISRQHLKFVFKDEKWYVEDVGSRNGTWLNGKLLMAYQRHLLRDMDEVRAGNVIMIVLTQAVKSAPTTVLPDAKAPTVTPGTITLSAKSINPSQMGLTPTFLGKYMLPYISAIIEMMSHVDRAKKRSVRELAVSKISLSNGIIHIDFTCQHEVLKFMMEHGKKPSTDVKLLTDGEADSPMPASGATLAKQFIDIYLPLLATDQSVYYQHLLEPLFQTCLESELSITTI